MNRRQFLRAGLGVAGGAVLGACSSGGRTFVDPAGREVLAAEARRATSGRVSSVTLNPTVSTVDLGGPMVRTWTYGGALPGAEIRIQRGDILEARLRNDLPTDTSVHWHGLALRNDMDGMPGVVQPPIAAGAEFTYRFAVDAPGTYWFHPHSGLQLDRGLYAPLIIEDPDETGRYDREWVVVLDDWLDGVSGGTPEAVLAQLQSSTMNMGAPSSPAPSSPAPSSPASSSPASSSPAPSSPAPSSPAPFGPAPTSSPTQPSAGAAFMGATSPLLGGDAGDVAYPYYLINGRIADAPTSFDAKAGERIRIRLINAAGDTAFRVALGEHRLRVTHTDGFPVVPVDVDTLLIGMGERYDLEVTAADGVFALVALAEGKDRTALALLRTAAGAAPSAQVRPSELGGALLRYDQLVPAAEVALAPREVAREHQLDLTAAMSGYSWGINGTTFAEDDPLAVSQNERVRLSFKNTTTMWHPMHLHGHTFQLNGGGPRKDTVAVLPGQTVTCDFDANNPGLWMVHCHNVYHQEAGMMRTLAYTS